jgi:hypothetical protein
MALNLMTICFGCDAIEDLEEWIEERLAAARRAGQPPEHWQTTRMIPTRADELIDGGSLYWVIRGSVQARQRLLEIRPFRDADGIQRAISCSPSGGDQWQPRRASRATESPDAPRTRRRAPGHPESCRRNRARPRRARIISVSPGRGGLDRRRVGDLDQPRSADQLQDQENAAATGSAQPPGGDEVALGGGARDPETGEDDGEPEGEHPQEGAPEQSWFLHEE